MESHAKQLCQASCTATCPEVSLVMFNHITGSCIVSNIIIDQMYLKNWAVVALWHKFKPYTPGSWFHDPLTKDFEDFTVPAGWYHWPSSSPPSWGRCGKEIAAGWRDDLAGAILFTEHVLESKIVNSISLECNKGMQNQKTAWTAWVGPGMWW